MEEITDFINYLRVEKRFSVYTVRSYHDDIVQYATYLQLLNNQETILLSQQADIRNWIISLVDDGCSPRTLRRKVASLKAIFKYYLRNNKIKLNPAEGLILPKLNKSLPSFIKETSIEHLFNSNLFSDNFKGLRDKFVLELLYATGIRLSELVNLKTTDIDMVRGEVRILGKRNKERIVPLTLNITRLLAEYADAVKLEFGQVPVEYLILTDSGEKVYPRMIQRLVEKYLSKSTTLEKRSPHLMRHTFATHMLNNGADLNAVKELLGHANLSATEIYTHNTYEKLKSIYKQAHPRA